MEIKEITSEEAQQEKNVSSDKVLRKSDKILDDAKENLTPAQVTKVTRSCGSKTSLFSLRTSIVLNRSKFKPMFHGYSCIKNDYLFNHAN